ncbi:MAG: hypothetical protein U0871_14115 [Gemmataceae bacterium]
MPPPTPGTARLTPTPTDLRRKAYAKLAERLDPGRTRHRPLSLVRAEAGRLLDHLLDTEAPTLSREERDRLAQDVLASAPGVGPLEELFRDEAVTEILVLAPAQVIVRKGDAWLPTSVRFRDGEQVKGVLARFAEVGEPLLPGSAPTGGVGVRLANGFRLIAVTPPEVMGQQPVVLLVRGPAPAAPTGGSTGIAWGAVLGRPLPTDAGPRPEPAPAPPAPPRVIGLVSTPPPVGPGSARMPAASLPPAPAADPLARFRQRLTERIITRFAAAGIYDLTEIPANELQRIVAAHVAEFCQQERMDADESLQQQLVLGILAGMNR